MHIRLGSSFIRPFKPLPPIQSILPRYPLAWRYSTQIARYAIRLVFITYDFATSQWPPNPQLSRLMFGSEVTTFPHSTNFPIDLPLFRILLWVMDSHPSRRTSPLWGYHFAILDLLVSLLRFEITHSRLPSIKLQPSTCLSHGSALGYWRFGPRHKIIGCRMCYWNS